MGLTVVLSMFVLCQTSVHWNAHGNRDGPPETIWIDKYCEKIEGDNCKEWKPARASVHQKIFDQAQKDMTEVGQAFERAHMGAMVVALRGNTACGKSTAIKKTIPETIPEFKAAHAVLALLGKKQFPTLNVDDYKKELRNTSSRDFQATPHDQIAVKAGKKKARAGDVFTDTDVHAESKTVKERVKKWVETAKLNGKPLSFIMDGRLAGPKDHETMYDLARRTNRKLTVIDIDCPLDVSLERVLGRSHDEFDPIPGFKQVATEGFVQSRANRPKFVHLYTDTRHKAHLGKYVLVTTTEELTQKTVMTINEDGQMSGHLPRAIAIAQLAEAEANYLKEEVLTDHVVKDVCNQRHTPTRKLKCKARLDPWRGKTWSAALNMHEAGEKPPHRQASGQ